MRLAILSDLHANEQALTSVLAAAEARDVDAIVCLGDVVGYGPDPAPVLNAIRASSAVTVLGNHDAAVATGEHIGVLPNDGQVAARQHRDHLDQADLDWLAALPLTATFEGVTLAHAAPLDPGEWPRLDSFSIIQRQFSAFETAVCFVGHSHRPAMVSTRMGATKVKPGARYLINVGSVGQPRDHDPRAAFGVFDTETMDYELVRVHYDVAKTVARIREQGLPKSLGQRLLGGV